MNLIFAFLLMMTLATIAYVDFLEMRIPDSLNILLLAGGVLFWTTNGTADVPRQLAFGASVALLFWAVRHGHARLTGRIGLGLGDVKMAGAGAVWISPVLFPLFLFVASFAGLAFALVRGLAIGTHVRAERLPFGPFLGLGLLLAWITEVSAR